MGPDRVAFVIHHYDDHMTNGGMRHGPLASSDADMSEREKNLAHVGGVHQ